MTNLLGTLSMTFPPRFDQRLREAVFERDALAAFGVDDQRRQLVAVGIEHGELVGQDAVSPLAFEDPFGVDTDAMNGSASSSYS